ncbi:predicted protein [Chaetoceros tenuissimus]|uniref:Uncharacterized protein n=1 Tax=Chaetoceros tenuissimus TaxID=426638 RepID=A0AAD3D4A5_9STRA|nr:predicted protein [Chaetoceros tenuissimus]
MFRRRGNVNEIADEMAKNCNDVLGSDQVQYFGSLDKLLRAERGVKYVAFIHCSSYHYTLILILGAEYLVYNPSPGENGRQGYGLVKDNMADRVSWDDFEKILGIRYVSKRYACFPKQTAGTNCASFCLAMFQLYFLDMCVGRSEEKFPLLPNITKFRLGTDVLVEQLEEDFSRREEESNEDYSDVEIIDVN